VTPYREINHGAPAVGVAISVGSVAISALPTRTWTAPMSGRTYCWPAPLMLAFV
jgi:hypothetical protein